MSSTRTRWTPERDDMLINLGVHQRRPLVEVAKIMDLSIRSVYNRRQRLRGKGFEGLYRYPPELVQTMVDMRRQGIKVVEIAHRLGKHCNAVGRTLKQNGVVLWHSGPWKNDEKTRLIELIGQGKTPIEVSSILGRTRQRMFKLLEKLYPLSSRPIQIQNFLYMRRGGLDKRVMAKVNAARKRATEKGWLFEIDIPWVLEQIAKQDRKCYYSNVSLDLGGKSDNSFSLERLEQDKGYTKDNVVVTTWEINRMKGALSRRRFIELCQRIAENTKAPI